METVKFADHQSHAPWLPSYYSGRTSDIIKMAKEFMDDTKIDENDKDKSARREFVHKCLIACTKPIHETKDNIIQLKYTGFEALAQIELDRIEEKITVEEFKERFAKAIEQYTEQKQNNKLTESIVKKQDKSEKSLPELIRELQKLMEPESAKECKQSKKLLLEKILGSK